MADAEATEGDDDWLNFVVKLDPPWASDKVVFVDYATADGTATAGQDYTAKSGGVEFRQGDSTVVIQVPIRDDFVEDDGETVQFILSNARVTEGAGSVTISDADATGTIHNTENASPTVSVSGASATEGDAVEFTVSLSAAGSQQVTVEYATSGGTATSGTDFAASSGTLAFAANETSKTVSVATTDDSADEDDETFTLTLSSPTNTTLGDATATGTIIDDDAPPPPLTASFQNMPTSHDGNAFTFGLAFSEDVKVSYRTLEGAAFEVGGGAVRGARRKQQGSNQAWEITVEPDWGGAVAMVLPATSDCAVSGAICTADGRPLSNAPSATVAGPLNDTPPPNTAATGAPTISGTPKVGEVLSVSTSGISDDDGRDNASFAYQWVRGSTDIEGANGTTYTVAAADEGRALKVRVSFTDDAGHEESLTSAATEAVAAPTPLTASFSGVPNEHTGEEFTFGLTFSENVKLNYRTLRDNALNYRTLRDNALNASGGTVRKAKRAQQGSNQAWDITVEPDGTGTVSLSLPETTDCGASGAICTHDDRPLSHALTATAEGPVGISVADGRVDENDGAMLAFVVTLSRAASGTPTVDYATADGTAQAGVDYTAASGTLTFPAGASSQTIEVSVLDDSHDEGEETLTLTLSNASRGQLTDGEATGTIKNTDPLPRALLARFGRTAAVHVVEHVEERLQAPREPGFRGRFAGRELRRGMEREIGLSLLNRLGGLAGVHPAGAGGPRALAGSAVGGGAAIGTPGLGGSGFGGSGLGGSALGMAAAGGPKGSMSGPAGPMGAASGTLGGGLLSMGLGGGDVLTGSAFSLNRETRRGGILSFWSRGAQSSFHGNEGALALNGDVRTTMFGADYAKGPVVMGLSLSNSRGLGEYAGANAGQVASSVTGLYPWLGYKATDRVTVWGVAGYGTGGMLLTPAGGPALESGLSMAMASAGTRGELIAGARAVSSWRSRPMRCGSARRSTPWTGRRDGWRRPRRR